MISNANNTYTGDMSALYDRWMHDIYQALITLNIKTDNDSDVIKLLAKERDEYFEAQKDDK